MSQGTFEDFFVSSIALQTYSWRPETLLCSLSEPHPVFQVSSFFKKIMILFYEVFRDTWYCDVHITLLAFKTYLFIHFWLCWVFVAARGLSLVAAKWSYSLVVVCGLLIEATSLVELTL